MRGAVLVALAAAIGNLLQGWDNSTIAGGLIYIKSEFHLETQPTLEGLIVAASLFGATVITMFCGSLADAIGRRPVLILSSVLFFISGLIMAWAPNVYVLVLARLLDGCGSGLAITLVPVYVSETAPPEIRGQLNTIPQFNNSGGMFLSYCTVFGMSLMKSPSWRLMLGVLCFPSAIYILLTVFYLPESPRWLAGRGRMAEAEQVLRRLRGKEDVSAELALLVEGLGSTNETSLEEYVIAPENVIAGDPESVAEQKKIRLNWPEEGQSWVAEPVARQSSRCIVRQGSSLAALMDPLVPLFGSVHEKNPETENIIMSMTGSMMGSGILQRSENWNIENPRPSSDHSEDGGMAYSDEQNLRSPLLSHQTGKDRDVRHLLPSSSTPNLGLGAGSGLMQGSGAGSGLMPGYGAGSGLIQGPGAGSGLMQGPGAGSGLVSGSGVMKGERASGDIGGGWQLAWKKAGGNGRKEGGVQRVYLHPGSAPISLHGSMASVHAPSDLSKGGGPLHAAALVSQTTQHPTGDSQSPANPKGSKWQELLEPGVKRALFVGVALQVLQQLGGINGVLYYAPQILKEAGAGALLSGYNISTESASLFISAIMTFCMLPCIFLSMKLMDVAGRRPLMLYTIPILIIALSGLIFSRIVDMGSVITAIMSAGGVIVYLSCFVMGFGVIPNILCAEIFPTKVRGICITITALTYWVGNLIMTYSFPVMLSTMGLAGVFTFYVVGCIMAWIFIYLKVPETKGMPLEVITEFFAAGARHSTTD